MKIDAKDPIAKDIEVLDLDTGEFVDLVTEAYENEKTGWYTQTLIDLDGNVKKCLLCDQFLHQRFCNVNIKLIYSPLDER